MHTLFGSDFTFGVKSSFPMIGAYALFSLSLLILTLFTPYLAFRCPSLFSILPSAISFAVVLTAPRIYDTLTSSIDAHWPQSGVVRVVCESLLYLLHGVTLVLVSVPSDLTPRLTVGSRDVMVTMEHSAILFACMFRSFGWIILASNLMVLSQVVARLPSTTYIRPLILIDGMATTWIIVFAATSSAFMLFPGTTWSLLTVHLSSTTISIIVAILYAIFTYFKSLGSRRIRAFNQLLATHTTLTHAQRATICGLASHPQTAALAQASAPVVSAINYDLSAVERLGQGLMEGDVKRAFWAIVQNVEMNHVVGDCDTTYCSGREKMRIDIVMSLSATPAHRTFNSTPFFTSVTTKKHRRTRTIWSSSSLLAASSWEDYSLLATALPPASASALMHAAVILANQCGSSQAFRAAKRALDSPSFVPVVGVQDVSTGCGLDEPRLGSDAVTSSLHAVGGAEHAETLTLLQIIAANSSDISPLISYVISGRAHGLCSCPAFYLTPHATQMLNTTQESYAAHEDVAADSSEVVAVHSVVNTGVVELAPADSYQSSWIHDISRDSSTMESSPAKPANSPTQPLVIWPTSTSQSTYGRSVSGCSEVPILPSIQPRQVRVPLSQVCRIQKAEEAMLQLVRARLDLAAFNVAAMKMVWGRFGQSPFIANDLNRYSDDASVSNHDSTLFGGRSAYPTAFNTPVTSSTVSNINQSPSSFWLEAPDIRSMAEVAEVIFKDFIHRFRNLVLASVKLIPPSTTTVLADLDRELPTLLLMSGVFTHRTCEHYRRLIATKLPSTDPAASTFSAVVECMRNTVTWMHSYLSEDSVCNMIQRRATGVAADAIHDPNSVFTDGTFDGDYLGPLARAQPLTADALGFSKSMLSTNPYMISIIRATFSMWPHGDRTFFTRVARQMKGSALLELDDDALLAVFAKVICKRHAVMLLTIVRHGNDASALQNAEYNTNEVSFASQQCCKMCIKRGSSARFGSDLSDADAIQGMDSPRGLSSSLRGYLERLFNICLLLVGGIIVSILLYVLLHISSQNITDHMLNFNVAFYMRLQLSSTIMGAFAANSTHIPPLVSTLLVPLSRLLGPLSPVGILSRPQFTSADSFTAHLSGLDPREVGFFTPKTFNTVFGDRNFALSQGIVATSALSSFVSYKRRDMSSLPESAPEYTSFSLGDSDYGITQFAATIASSHLAVSTLDEHGALDELRRIFNDTSAGARVLLESAPSDPIPYHPLFTPSLNRIPPPLTILRQSNNAYIEHVVNRTSFDAMKSSYVAISLIISGIICYVMLFTIIIMPSMNHYRRICGASATASRIIALRAKPFIEWRSIMGQDAYMVSAHTLGLIILTYEQLSGFLTPAFQLHIPRSHIHAMIQAVRTHVQPVAPISTATAYAARSRASDKYTLTTRTVSARRTSAGSVSGSLTSAKGLALPSTNSRPRFSSADKDTETAHSDTSGPFIRVKYVLAGAAVLALATIMSVIVFNYTLHAINMHDDMMLAQQQLTDDLFTTLDFASIEHSGSIVDFRFSLAQIVGDGARPIALPEGSYDYVLHPCLSELNDRCVLRRSGLSHLSSLQRSGDSAFGSADTSSERLVEVKRKLNNQYFTDFVDIVAQISAYSRNFIHSSRILAFAPDAPYARNSASLCPMLRARDAITNDEIGSLVDTTVASLTSSVIGIDRCAASHSLAISAPVTALLHLCNPVMASVDVVLSEFVNKKFTEVWKQSLGQVTSEEEMGKTFKNTEYITITAIIICVLVVLVTITMWIISTCNLNKSPVSSFTERPPIIASSCSSAMSSPRYQTLLSKVNRFSRSSDYVNARTITKATLNLVSSHLGIIIVFTILFILFTSNLCYVRSFHDTAAFKFNKTMQPFIDTLDVNGGQRFWTVDPMKLVATGAVEGWSEPFAEMGPMPGYSDSGVFPDIFDEDNSILPVKNDIPWLTETYMRVRVAKRNPLNRLGLINSLPTEPFTAVDGGVYAARAAAYFHRVTKPTMQALWDLLDADFTFNSPVTIVDRGFASTFDEFELAALLSVSISSLALANCPFSTPDSLTDKEKLLHAHACFLRLQLPSWKFNSYLGMHPFRAKFWPTTTEADLVHFVGTPNDARDTSLLLITDLSAIPTAPCVDVASCPKLLALAGAEFQRKLVKLAYKNTSVVRFLIIVFVTLTCTATVVAAIGAAIITFGVNPVKLYRVVSVREGSELRSVVVSNISSASIGSTHLGTRDNLRSLSDAHGSVTLVSNRHLLTASANHDSGLSHTPVDPSLSTRIIQARERDSVSEALAGSSARPPQPLIEFRNRRPYVALILATVSSLILFTVCSVLSVDKFTDITTDARISDLSGLIAEQAIFLADNVRSSSDFAIEAHKSVPASRKACADIAFSFQDTAIRSLLALPHPVKDIITPGQATELARKVNDIVIDRFAKQLRYVEKLIRVLSYGLFCIFLFHLCIALILRWQNERTARKIGLYFMLFDN